MPFDDHFLPGLLDAQQATLPLTQPAPATEKQIAYARALAARSGAEIPRAAFRDRQAISAWIDAQKAARPVSRFDAIPSAKQVAFAERIARLKRRQIPPECFRDKKMMSRWIDSNKP